MPDQSRTKDAYSMTDERFLEMVLSRAEGLLVKIEHWEDKVISEGYITKERIEQLEVRMSVLTEWVCNRAMEAFVNPEDILLLNKEIEEIEGHLGALKHEVNVILKHLKLKL